MVGGPIGRQNVKCLKGSTITRAAQSVRTVGRSFRSRLSRMRESVRYAIGNLGAGSGSGESSNYRISYQNTIVISDTITDLFPF